MASGLKREGDKEVKVVKQLCLRQLFPLLYSICACAQSCSSMGLAREKSLWEEETEYTYTAVSAVCVCVCSLSRPASPLACHSKWVFLRGSF